MALLKYFRKVEKELEEEDKDLQTCEEYFQFKKAIHEVVSRNNRRS